MTLEEILQLEPGPGADCYIGRGPHYCWGGLYGGQLIAQALQAAAATVPPDRTVHSLHAHFIRRGRPAAPVDYAIERERDGRSFSTRLVHAAQSDRRLLACTVSFQQTGDPPARQALPMPALPPASALDATADWLPQFERRGLPEFTRGRLSSAAWCRVVDGFPADPALQAAALAYMSDDLPTETVMLARPELGESLADTWSASLDHAVWFHRPLDARDWLLFSFECVGLAGDRGLAQGQVFDRQGRHLATISQEVLARPRL